MCHFANVEMECFAGSSHKRVLPTGRCEHSKLDPLPDHLVPFRRRAPALKRLMSGPATSWHLFSLKFRRPADEFPF